MNDFIQSWSDGGYAAFTNFGVAVLSLIVAICAWISSSKANRRLIAIEEGRDRKADMSEAKARLIAAIKGSRLEDLRQVLPSLPETTVRSLLNTLKRRNEAYSLGRSRGAKWFPGQIPPEGGDT